MAKIKDKFLETAPGGGEDYGYLRGIALQNALDILEMQAADTLESGQSANLIRDVFSDANGYLNTVDTDETDAVYIGMSYNNLVGYIIEAASYDSKSFLTNNQDTAPRGLFFKSDGTKVYVIGATNDAIYQYTLSTAWDISTASYDSKSFSVASQEGTPFGLFFKSDGTKVYVIGTTNDAIYQYTLSTAWDISTASYDSISYSVATQDATPSGLIFSQDGHQFYIIGTANKYIYQYSSSGASPDSKIVYVSKTLDTTPTHLQFFAWKTETTLTGNITVDVSFDGGDNYQTGIQLDTPTEIINTGTEMILKINLNKGASDGEVSLNGYGIMLWGEA